VTSYELEVRKTDLGEAALVELTGELDLTNADDLERRLEELSAAASGLVLDLNRILFLDSAALHVLFRLARRLELDRKAFGIVVAPTALVAKTVAIVNLDKATTVRPSLEAVLAELHL
jgi:anti-anti-sigma factor